VLSIAPRAPPQFDLASLLSQIQVPGQAMQQQEPSLFLHDLLSTANTTPLVENMSEKTVDSLISNLPPALVPANASLSQKKQIITKVLRSPQFTQGAVSLTVALREGALRGVADSLKIPLLPGEEVSGDPVEVFVKGIKREVEKEGDN
jgi:26S proteasome regulatory subunit N13